MGVEYFPRPRAQLGAQFAGAAQRILALALGSATNDRATERQLSGLKSAVHHRRPL